MNSSPKIVVSKTLQSADWQNSTIVRDTAALREIRERPGKEIATTGSATLVRSLLKDDLLDELRLLVHPIVVGTGKRLFEDGMGKIPLTLLSSKTFNTGVLSLTYGRAAVS